MTVANATILRPASTAEFAGAIRAAAAEKMQIRFTGSDSLPLTRFDGERGVQQISTLRMNKVIEHAVSDMTVIVQAGITLEALQRQLAWHNQWLPVDPPAYLGRPAGQRTLAGLIASNSLGPLRFSCAGGCDWRLLIMGMTWVDASGAVIKGGGRTLKNAAGYSTPRMMIGSCGSLGGIAEVTLRTFARPAEEQAVVFYCESAERGEELLAEILLAPVTPAYLEVVGGRTFASNPLQLPAPKRGVALVAGFLDRAESCAAQVEILRGLSAARNLESISQGAAPAGRLRLWLTSEPALTSAGAEGYRADGLGVRIHGLSSQSCAIVAQLEAAVKRERSGDAASGAAGIWAVSEAGTGVVRAVLNTPGASTILESVRAQFPGISLIPTQGVHLPSDGAFAFYPRLKVGLDPQGVFGDPLSW